MDVVWQIKLMNDGSLIVNMRESGKQLFRYALVGIFSNIAGYIVYLVLTNIGGTPKATMSLLYGVGASVGFFGNKKLTFKHEGGIIGAGIRYIIAHFFGYLINLGILILFVDRMGYSHELVQAIAVFIVAAFLFLAFKVFVFPVGNESTGDGR